MTHADDPARALPPPSDAAWDFIARAASNPHFRRMIERLAREDTLMDADQAQPAPLSDERLAELMRHIEYQEADNARLRAEVAARDEIVRAVADATLKFHQLADYTEASCLAWPGVESAEHWREQARALLAADSEH